MSRGLIATCAVLACLAATGGLGAARQQGGGNQPGTTMTEARMREIVDVAG